VNVYVFFSFYVVVCNTKV